MNLTVNEVIQFDKDCELIGRVAEHLSANKGDATILDDWELTELVQAAHRMTEMATELRGMPLQQ